MAGPSSPSLSLLKPNRMISKDEIPITIVNDERQWLMLNDSHVYIPHTNRFFLFLLPILLSTVPSNCMTSIPVGDLYNTHDAAQRNFREHQGNTKLIKKKESQEREVLSFVSHITVQRMSALCLF